MFNQLLWAAVTAASLSSASIEGWSSDGSALNVAMVSLKPRAELPQALDVRIDEIMAWLTSNFDLPPTAVRPAIVFVSKSQLEVMRSEDRAPSQAIMGSGEQSGRGVVALYESNLKTIFLSDDWTGQSPSEQSVLVHELVHHLQVAAGLKFECPMAKEKMAYLAQDKWLGRFGMTLEQEFEVDKFTVLIASACMY